MQNNYKIIKQECSGYDLYQVEVLGQVKYCYYEKSGNQFANRVFIVIGNGITVNNFWERSIYSFFGDLLGVEETIKVLENEFDNLNYIFVVEDEGCRDSILRIMRRLRLEGKIIDKREFALMGSRVQVMEGSNLEQENSEKKNGGYQNVEVYDQDVNFLEQDDSSLSMDYSGRDDFCGQDNLYLKTEKKGEKKLEEVDQTFLGYNGYNERLIDDNVKNIVQLRKSNGGEN